MSDDTPLSTAVLTALKFIPPDDGYCAWHLGDGSYSVTADQWTDGFRIEGRTADLSMTFATRPGVIRTVGQLTAVIGLFSGGPVRIA